MYKIFNSIHYTKTLNIFTLLWHHWKFFSKRPLFVSVFLFLSHFLSLSLSLKFDIMLLHFIYSNEVTEYEHLTALPVLSTRICNIVYFTAVFCYNFQMGIYVMQNYTHLNGEYPQFKKTTCITL